MVIETSFITPYLWLIGMLIAILGYYMGFIDGHYCTTNPWVASTKQVLRGILFVLLIAFIVIQLGCASVESRVRPSGWCEIVTDDSTATTSGNDGADVTDDTPTHSSCEIGMAASIISSEKGKFNGVLFIGPSVAGVGGAYCPGNWCLGLGVGAPYSDQGWFVNDNEVYAGVTIDIVQLIKGQPE